MITPASTVSFVRELLLRVPELQSVYDMHIDDHDELLPHVFLGEVTRYVVQQVQSGAGETSQPLSRILDFFEQSVESQDEKLQELISVSFLENLVDCGDVMDQLTEILGPNLKRELEAHGR